MSLIFGSLNIPIRPVTPIPPFNSLTPPLFSMHPGKAKGPGSSYPYPYLKAGIYQVRILLLLKLCCESSPTQEILEINRGKITKAHTIVRRTVLHNQLHMFSELFTGWVEPFADVLPQCLKVHWFCDDLVIIFDNLPINRLVEGVSLRKREGISMVFTIFLSCSSVKFLISFLCWLTDGS